MTTNKMGIAVLTTLSLLATTVLAFDEGLVRLSLGTATLRDGSDTMIRMESERVVITVAPDAYTVDAEFVFFNPGPTVTETVGFPNHAFGYARGYNFKGAEFPDEFETWVNGIPQEVQDVPGSMNVGYRIGGSRIITDADEIERIRHELVAGSASEIVYVQETRWIVKTVTFNENERTVTRVRYRAPYSNFSDAEYYYGSGASWSGSIGEAVFVLRWSTEAWYRHPPVFAESNIYSWTSIQKPDIRRTGKYECEFVLKDLEPKDTELLGFFQADPSRPIQPWEGVQFGAMFEYGDKPITEELLAILSLSQLELLSHAIEANRGKVFESVELDEYFRSRYWYSPRSNYSDSHLTALDRANIRTVESYTQALREKLKP